MTGGRLPPKFLDELRARTSIVEVAKQRVTLRRAGREWLGSCPFHNEKSASFTVNEKKAFVHCFGCGAHGDALEFVQRHDGFSFMDAVRHLASQAGMAIPGDDSPPPAVPLKPIIKRPAPEDEEKRDAYRIANAVRMWKAGRPWRGTLVQTYLTGRHCCPADDLPTLRFAAGLKYEHQWDDETWCRGTFDAQIAPFQNVSRDITAVHVTYLGPDGDKAPVPKAKKMFGPVWGSAIRFAAPARSIAIAEGIETALSVRRACPDRAVWVAGSLGNIAGSGDPDTPKIPHPVTGKPLPTVMPLMRSPGIRLPAGVEEIVILADADGDRLSGNALVERAARRFRAEAVRVRVAWPKPGQDFNDMIREGVTV